MGTLFVVATPIGNLEDISARALRVLREVDLIAAEDTRHTGRLLQRFAIATPMLSYHAFNERARRVRLLTALAAGDVALVTDAGTPGIADPGAALVAAAREAGFPVSPVPGPSSLVAALSVAGLAEGPFVSLGFLPRKGEERRIRLVRAASTGFALVLFEAPGRLVATLNELADLLGDRPAVVGRELTKLHEEVRHGTLTDLGAHYAEVGVRGECAIVVAAEGDAGSDTETPETVVARLLRSGLAPSAAAREAARLTGLPRSTLYEMARRTPTDTRSGLDE